jgi:hypothetical protein
MALGGGKVIKESEIGTYKEEKEKRRGEIYTGHIS